ncbi:MAG: lysophospholipase, partial [Candidatus Marinimicrobia bacterium]|nr:lysophospholipase [Candidatus Neomarinimicrobiota bacterium]
DGLELFKHSYQPQNDYQTVLIIVHGIAEHCERYSKLAKFLVENNIAVETYDQSGHGRSDGERCYIDYFEEYLKDLDMLIRKLEREHPHRDIFLMGHSMGGAIVSYYYLKYRPTLTGLILSSPAVDISPQIHPLLALLSGLMGNLFPRLKTIKLNSDKLTHDRKIVEEYNKDEYVYHNGIPARTGAELNRVVKLIQKDMPKIDLPLLILQGDKDNFVNPDASIELYKSSRSGDKSLKIYNGFYHEIFNEIKKEQVIDDLIVWIKERS